MRVLVLAHVLVVLFLLPAGLHGLGCLVPARGGLGCGHLVVRRLDVAQGGCGASVRAQCAQWVREGSRGMAEAGAGCDARCAVCE